MKKAEMGIGTLLLFITFILIAAIASSLVINSANSAQEKALIAGDQASSQVRTNVRVVEVTGMTGRGGHLSNFTMTVKLSPGSDPIHLGNTVITFRSTNNDTTYSFAGADAPYDLTTIGYTTNKTWYSSQKDETVNGSGTAWEPLQQDYDYDGIVDTLIYDPDASTVVLNLTTDGLITLGQCGPWTEDAGLFPNSYLISVSADCNGGTVENVTLSPIREKTNLYAIETLHKGVNYIKETLQQGDVVKIFFESPMPVTEFETVRISIIPKVGTPSITEFEMPYTSSEMAYLWP